MKLFFTSFLLLPYILIDLSASHGQGEESRCCCRDGRDGKDGKDGKDGRDGRDVIAYHWDGTQFQGANRKLTLTFGDGTQGQTSTSRNMELAELKTQQGLKGKEAESEVALLKKQVQSLEERLKKVEDEGIQAKDKFKAAQQADSIRWDTTLSEVSESTRGGVRGKGTGQSGLGKRTLSDISWQAQHIAAASACRALTQSKRTAGIHSVVLVRNASDKKSCTEICANSWASNCEAEVSLWGMAGKAKRNGQEVANFYNYGCEYNTFGGNEASADDDAIFSDFREAHLFLFSYCCCSFGM